MTAKHDFGIDALMRCRLPMPASNSAAAVILVDGAEYLMQLRDQKPTIYYPGHWGLFGGAVDGGETPEQALRRELEEELGLHPAEIEFFTEFNFDLRFIGEEKIYRRYYEIRITSDQIASLRLAEGSAMEAFVPETLLALRLVPYDSFAVWLHHVKRCGTAIPQP